MKNILDRYYEFRDESDFCPLGETIFIDLDNNFGEIKYTFPTLEEEVHYTDHMWYCPALFSMFKAEDFFKILTAIMLERSMVFVSDNITLLSSAILGLKTLIKPF